VVFGLGGGKDIVEILIKAKDQTAAAFRTVEGSMGRLEASAARVRSGVNKVAKATALIGGAATIAAIGLSTKVFMGFEQSIANTASVSGATGEALKKLEDAAREMGKTTAFSASQAADAMYYLGSAGYDTEQIIGSLNGVMLLAGATQADLAYTSETVVSTLNAFGMAAEESDRVANTFAATIAGSQANIEKLSTSMSYVGPIAHELGWNIEQTSAALGQLYNAGYDGSMAGTILRGAMTQLLNPTAKVADTLAKYGLTVEDINPKTHSLSELIATLSDVGLESADTMAIFGQRAGPGMMTLLGKGSEALDELTGKITGTNAAAEMYETQMDTLKGTIAILKSALEEVGIVIGKTVAPYLAELANKVKDNLPPLMAFLSKLKDELQPSFESLKNIISSLKNILKTLFVSEDGDRVGKFAAAVNKLMGFVEKLFAFIEKHPALVEFAVKIGALVIAISYAIPVIQGLIATFAAVKTAIMALSVFMAANPMVLALMAIVAAIALLYMAWTNNWGGIQDKVKAVVAFLTPAFELIKGKLKAVKDYLPLLLGPIGLVYTAFKNWDKIKETVTGLADTVKDKFSAMKDKISDFTRKVQDKLGLTKKEMLVMASPAGPIVALKKAWDSNFMGIQDKTRAVMDTVKEKIGSAISTIKSKVDELADLPGKAYKWGEKLIQSFIDGIAAKIAELKAKITEVADLIMGYIGITSPAKLGPLRNLEKWGPNLVKTFSKGIEAALPKLNLTLGNIAAPTTIMGDSATGASTKTITNYFSFGSVDSKERADYIIREIEKKLKTPGVL